MKIVLIRKDGNVIGWTIEGENEQEMRTIGSIRNMIYFGINEDAIKYAGVKSYGKDDEYAQKLAWIKKAYNDEFSFSRLDSANNLIVPEVKEE